MERAAIYSGSFPYLHIATTRGLPYGEVVRMAELLERGSCNGAGDVSFRTADLDAISAAIDLELRRRAGRG